MSLFTAAAIAARRKFPRVPPTVPPAALSAGQVRAFEPLRITVPPDHGTPRRILSQGARGNAYVRRPGVKATDVGKIDYYARDRIGADTFTVELDGGASLDVTIEITDAPLHATVRYVDAETGDDGNNGSSPGAPWRTWGHACANAPANSTVIFKGRRTDGRVQVYSIPIGAGYAATVANSNVEFKADPADVAAGFKPMIWTEGDKFRKYYDELNSGHWVNDGTGNNTYQTVATDLPTSAYSLVGYYQAPNGRWVKLYFLKVGGVTQLRNRQEVRETSRDTLYPGPSMAVSGGRFYVRLQDCTNTKVYANAGLGQTGTRDWDWSASGTGWLPASLDPNALKIIFVGTQNQGIWGTSTVGVRVAGKTNVVFKNLVFASGSFGIRFESCSNCRVLGCTFLLAMPHLGTLNQDSISYVSACVQYDGACSNMTIDRCYMSGGSAPWTTYRETKAYWTSGASHRAMAVDTRDTGTHTNLVVRNSVVTQFGIHWVWSEVCNNMLWHHNELSWSQIDGGFISHPGSSANMRFIRNLMWGATLWGPTWANAAGWDTNNHHYGFNIITSAYWVYEDAGYWSTKADDRATRRFNVGHGGQTAVGRNMYHNTWFGGPSPDVDDGNFPGATAVLGDPRPWSADGGRALGFNNLLVMRAKSERHAEGQNAGRDAIITFLDRGQHGSNFDGNHYALIGGASAFGYLGSGRRVHVAAVQNNASWPPAFTLCANLAAIRSATPFEDQGSEGDPGWDDGSGPQWPEPEDVAAYMIDTAGAAAQPGASIAGQSWFKDMDGFTEITRTLDAPYRGALDPDVEVHELEIGPL